MFHSSAPTDAYGVLEVDFRRPHNVDVCDLSFPASVAAVLAEGIETRKRQDVLAADRDAKVTLLREQQHRIRNNFQMIASLLERNAMISRDAQVKADYKEIHRRVFAMASLYDHLLGLGEHGESVQLAPYLSSICASFENFYDLRGNNVHLVVSTEEGAGLQLGIDRCTAIGTVVNELVANAMEHAFAGRPGTITVSMRRASTSLSIEVCDDGRGYGADTKENTGVRTARRLVTGMGATLVVETKLPTGTTWNLSLPLRPIDPS